MNRLPLPKKGKSESFNQCKKKEGTSVSSHQHTSGKVMGANTPED
jgi:hypothetical protein